MHTFVNKDCANIQQVPSYIGTLGTRPDKSVCRSYTICVETWTFQRITASQNLCKTKSITLIYDL